MGRTQSRGKAPIPGMSSSGGVGGALDVKGMPARELAELKMQDMNTTNIESAVRSIEGTARSMGIEIGD